MQPDDSLENASSIISWLFCKRSTGPSWSIMDYSPSMHRSPIGFPGDQVDELFLYPTGLTNWQ